MKTYLLRARHAVTLTELLVVLAIISLLATAAVPVYVNKTEQARRTTARSEVRAIGEAEQNVVINHGYIIPIHILDNLADLPSGVTDSDARDDFENYPGSGSNIYVIDPFVDARQQQGNQPTFNIGGVSSNNRVARMINFWTGPFLNPTRVYSGDRGENDPDELTQQEVSFDLVLDPWGNPYRLYSPIGIVTSRASTDVDIPSINNANQLDDGFLTITDDRFQAYTIVSYGANGESDGDTAIDDDVYYEFMYETSESAFNAF